MDELLVGQMELRQVCPGQSIPSEDRHAREEEGKKEQSKDNQDIGARGEKAGAAWWRGTRDGRHVCSIP
jgi:hypothetical protein